MSHVPNQSEENKEQGSSDQGKGPSVQILISTPTERSTRLCKIPFNSFVGEADVNEIGTSP